MTDTRQSLNEDHWLTRRTVLLWGTSLVAMVAGMRSGFAQQLPQDPKLQQFLTLSRRLTAYDTLDETIAKRTYDALCAEKAANADAFAQLAIMSRQAADAKALQSMAQEAGLAEAITDLC